MLVKARYQPKLDRFLLLCQQNYGRFMHLFRFEEDSVEIKTKQMVCTLRHVEATRYTDVVEVDMRWPTIVMLPPLHMRVRLYHDAAVAEVLSYQQISKLFAVYHYPNDNMYQPDEKYRVNAFLQPVLSQLLTASNQTHYV